RTGWRGTLEHFPDHLEDVCRAGGLARNHDLGTDVIGLVNGGRSTIKECSSQIHSRLAPRGPINVGWAVLRLEIHHLDLSLDRGDRVRIIRKEEAKGRNGNSAIGTRTPVPTIEQA